MRGTRVGVVLAHRAAALHAMGVASSADGRPAVAVRQLRAALRSIDRALVQPDDDRLSELRGRVLISLAWAEAERGNVALGFRLLDEAEPLIPARQRGVLLGQRALLLRRTGRDERALRQCDAAIALLGEASEPLDLAKALSNRGLLHLGAARAGLARADLRKSAAIAARHGFDLPAAVAQHNLGDLDLLAGDIPAALRTYGAVARVYETQAPGKLPELAIDRARALLAAGLFSEADRELAAARSSLGNSGSVTRMPTRCSPALRPPCWPAGPPRPSTGPTGPAITSCAATMAAAPRSRRCSRCAAITRSPVPRPRSPVGPERSPRCSTVSGWAKTGGSPAYWRPVRSRPSAEWRRPSARLPGWAVPGRPTGSTPACCGG